MAIIDRDFWNVEGNPIFSINGDEINIYVRIFNNSPDTTESIVVVKNINSARSLEEEPDCYLEPCSFILEPGQSQVVELSSNWSLWNVDSLNDCFEIVIREGAVILSDVDSVFVNKHDKSVHDTIEGCDTSIRPEDRGKSISESTDWMTLLKYGIYGGLALGGAYLIYKMVSNK